MTRALITGAGGFVGRILLRELHDAGVEVVAGLNRAIEEPPLPVECEEHPVDLIDAQDVRALIDTVKPDCVYHLGAMAFVPAVNKNRELAYQVNVNGTLHLLEAIAALGRKVRFLLTSSSQVYSNSNAPLSEADPAKPLTFYGLTKRGAEVVAEYYQSDTIDIVISRAFNHIGPGQADTFVLPSFAKQIAAIEKGEQEPVVRVGNLSAERDFTDVRDVVRAYCLLGRESTPPGIYNVCSGKADTIRNQLETMLALSTESISVEIDPERYREGEQPRIVGCNDRIRAATGWEPRVDPKQTIAEILDEAR